MNNMEMLFFDRIDVSEVTGVNKTNKSKEQDICHYRYLLNIGFNFQPYVCNRCHDFLMSMSLSNIAILKIENADNRFIITGVNWGYKINTKYWINWKKWTSGAKLRL